VIALNGSSLTLNLPLAFGSAFAGSKNVYMWAGDAGGANSGWQTRGAWTVPSTTVSVTADSVTPSTGSGVNQTFVLQYSDTAGAASLFSVWVWFNTTFSGSAANSCMVYYSRPANTVYLLKDDASSWNGATVGSNTTLQSSQCSLNVANIVIALNGSSLTLNLPLVFGSAFAGSKNVYMWAGGTGAVNSGWQGRGNWNVQ
jgi:hypothetical protein